MQQLHKSFAWLSFLLLLPHSANAQPVAGKPPILAHVNGTNATELSFKILQLADLHFSGDPMYLCQDPPSNLRREDSPCTEALTSNFIDELLDLEKPDFVVFTGDNVQTFSQESQQRAVDAFTRGVEERGIPFAVVLGNHDDENGFSREDIMELVMQKNRSYAQRGPQTVDGVGNYQLSVKAPVDGPWGNTNDSVFHMYFLDSGGYPDRQKYPNVRSTYDWIKSNQVEYYRNLSLAVQNESCNNSARADTITVPTASSKGPLPAVMFFHIPLQEYEFSTVNWYERTGDVNEQVMASSVHSELFDALVERNEVKATFVGHDHINEYCYNRQGVQLCYGGGAGFGVAYGSPDFPRRARVIEWSVNHNNERTIKSWRRLFGQMDSKYGEEVLFMQSTQGRVGLAAVDGSDATSGSSSALRTDVVSVLLGMFLLSISDPTRPCKDAPRNLGVPCTEALMSQFIGDLLDVEKPDLVVFSDDAIQTLAPQYRQVAVDALTRGVEAGRIPHAEVLGNHDDDSGFDREDMLTAMMNKSFSYTQRGPNSIEGVGNYQLSVQALVDGAWRKAGENVFHMYFLDSGGNLNKTKYPDEISRYDWIHESQVQYYRELSDAAHEVTITASSGAQLCPMPAVMFIHIPLQEFAEASLKYWWRTGEMNEKVEPSQVHSPLFSALVRKGEVKAVFAGHDHTNSYCFRKNGVQLCCAGGAALGLAYSSEDFSRRARVLEWSVDNANQRTTRSWERLFGKLDERYGVEVLFTQDPQAKVGLTSGGGGYGRALDSVLWVAMMTITTGVWLS